MVWTGMRCRRIAAMVCRSMPPALSAPSLNSTIAPNGRDEDSASTRSSVSPMREAGAAPVELVRLLNPLRLFAELVEPHLELSPERLEQSAVEQRLGGGLASAGRRPYDMLRESSTSTATTFCWGRRVATLSAGCHSRNRISATMQVSSSQMARGRRPLSIP